jgi:prepilin-type N-terminal cleavage/methylation domain-containing protein
MTNPSIRRTRGFTLIELLVVISIIAVLAAAGFAAGNAAIQRAKKTTALNVATAIEQAVNNFYNEYGYLPSKTNTDTTIQTNPAEAQLLLEALTGKENDPPEFNTKAINFLTVKEGKGDKSKGRDGMIYENNKPVAIFDPWGGTYKIRLNLDYDPILTVQPKGATSSRNLNARQVAVWSDGADGSDSATIGKASDDVVTW